MKLDQLPIGHSGKIVKVDGEGALRRRLLDMGLTPGTTIHLRKAAPMGDPVELELRGYSLTLRLEDAANIEISEFGAENPQANGKGLQHRHRGARGNKNGK